MKGKVRTTKKRESDISRYLSDLSAKQRSTLEKIRKTIQAAVPDAEQCIAYDMPAFRLDGRFLVSFAAWKDHCAFYPGSYAIKTHKTALKSYDTDKGTIRFSVDQPLPSTLVGKLVKSRIKQMTR